VFYQQINWQFPEAMNKRKNRRERQCADENRKNEEDEEEKRRKGIIQSGCASPER
jgi:hypothetical protein